MLAPNPRQTRQVERQRQASWATLEALANRYGDCDATSNVIASQKCIIVPTSAWGSNVLCWNWLRRHRIHHLKWVADFTKNKYGSKFIFNGAVVTLADAMVIRRLILQSGVGKRWCQRVAKRHADSTRPARVGSIAARREARSARIAFADIGENIVREELQRTVISFGRSPSTAAS